MKTVSTIIMTLLSSALFAADGDNYLKALTRSIEQMESYEVQFAIGVEDQALGGSYIVAEDQYLISFGLQIVMGANGERTTVDSYNREVIHERIDESVPMLLANPATAFSQLEGLFDSHVVSSNSEYVDLQLNPKHQPSMIEGVMLRLSLSTALPQQITYQAEGEKIEITINSFEQYREPLPSLPPLDDYEVIDLR